MNATEDLFGLAVVGYLLLYFFNYTRFYISQRSNYETLFLSIVSGCGIVILGQIMSLQYCIAEKLESIRTAIPEPVIFNPESGIIRLDHMVIAVLLAIILDTCLLPWHFSIKKWMDKHNLIVVRLQENCIAANLRKKKDIPIVEIYTSSNSKYTGFVLNAPPMNRSRTGDLELLAFYQEWVDGNTGNETTSADYVSLAYSEEQKKAKEELTEKLLKLQEFDQQEIDRIDKEYKQRMKQIDDNVIWKLPQIVVPLAEIVAVKKDAAPEKRQKWRYKVEVETVVFF